MPHTQTIEIKVAFDEYDGENGGWRVFTSRNGNGWWVVGVGFPTEEVAQRVADVIRAEATN